MKKSIQDPKGSLGKKEGKQQRLREEGESIEKDIRMLHCLIVRKKRAVSPQAPRKREITRKRVGNFFSRIALFYEDLQRRLNLRIACHCFCRWLYTRYESESRYRDRRKLSPYTILGHFRKEEWMKGKQPLLFKRVMYCWGVYKKAIRLFKHC